MAQKVVKLDPAEDYVAKSVPASGNTTIFQVGASEGEKLRHLLVEITNSVVNLDVFQVDYRADANGAWVNIYAAAGTYTSPAGDMFMCTADPTGLAAGSSVMLKFKDLTVYDLRIQASATGGTAVTTAYARGVRW